MTIKRIVTGFLLLFVAVSIGALAGKELRREDPAGFSGRTLPDGSPGISRKIIVYYFVGKIRCASCRKIEESSRKAIVEAFPDELSDGRLRFLVVDVDQPGNRHFVEEFRLSGSALVLVETRDGIPVSSIDLPEVWTLVEDESRLMKHVREQVASRLRGA